jgi:hypothetical protein
MTTWNRLALQTLRPNQIWPEITRSNYPCMFVNKSLNSEPTSLSAAKLGLNFQYLTRLTNLGFVPQGMLCQTFHTRCAECHDVRCFVIAHHPHGFVFQLPMWKQTTDFKHHPHSPM